MSTQTEKEQLSLEEIESIRKELGLTKVDLAHACGIKDPSLHYHYEKGDIPLKYQKPIKLLFAQVRGGGPITVGEVARIGLSKESAKEKEERREDFDKKEEEKKTEPNVPYPVKKKDAASYEDVIEDKRKELKMSQAFIANLIGVADSTYSNWMRNGVPDKHKPQINKALTMLSNLSLDEKKVNTSKQVVDDVELGMDALETLIDVAITSPTLRTAIDALTQSIREQLERLS